MFSGVGGGLFFWFVLVFGVFLWLLLSVFWYCIGTEWSLFCLSDWVGAGVVLARATEEGAVF